MFQEKAVKACCNSHLRSWLHSQGVLTLILGLRWLLKKSGSREETSCRLASPLFPCSSQPVLDSSDGVGSALLVVICVYGGGGVWFVIWWWAREVQEDRQTDRQTDRHTLAHKYHDLPSANSGPSERIFTESASL